MVMVAQPYGISSQNVLLLVRPQLWRTNQQQTKNSVLHGIMANGDGAGNDLHDIMTMAELP
jgi:hypothetical protein